MEFVKALILICSVQLAPADCTDVTARAVINGPDTPEYDTCGADAQRLLSQTALGRDMAADEYMKVVCGPAPRAHADAPASDAATLAEALR